VSFISDVKFLGDGEYPLFKRIKNYHSRERNLALGIKNPATILKTFCHFKVKFMENFKKDPNPKVL